MQSPKGHEHVDAAAKGERILPDNKPAAAPRSVATSGVATNTSSAPPRPVVEAAGSTPGPRPTPPPSFGAIGRPAPALPAGSSVRHPRGVAQAAAALHRALAGVDLRLTYLLLQPARSDDPGFYRLEAQLLANLHQAIVGQLAQIRADAALLDGLIDFADTVRQTLGDLEAGGSRHLARCLTFLGDTIGAFAALGGRAQGAKKVLQAMRQQLHVSAERAKEAPDMHDVAPLQAQAGAAFTAVAQEFERTCPIQHPTWLDRLWQNVAVPLPQAAKVGP